MPNPERINIKDLTLEEPEKKRELPFNPERDLMEEDWEAIKGSIEDSKKDGGLYDFVYRAWRAKILFPERAAQLEIEDEVWENIKNDFERRLRGGSPVLDYTEYVQAIKHFSPERYSEITNSKDKFIANAKKDLEEYKGLKVWYSFAWLAANMKVIFPEDVAQFNFDHDLYMKLKDSLKDSDYPSYDYAWFAACIKILFPEKSSEIEPDENKWRFLKGELEGMRKASSSIPFIKLSAAMKLLAAEEIKITDEGLEVIMPKEKPEFKEETPPMPQTRKF